MVVQLIATNVYQATFNNSLENEKFVICQIMRKEYLKICNFLKRAKNTLYMPKMSIFRSPKVATNNRIKLSKPKSEEKNKRPLGYCKQSCIFFYYFSHLKHRKKEKCDGLVSEF